MATKVMYLRVAEDVHERIRAEADERGLSMSRLAEQLLRESIERLLPPQKVRFTK